MQTKKRRKHHFNLVDICLILIISAAIAAIGYFFFWNENKDARYLDFTYVVTLDQVAADADTGLAVGKTVTDDKSGKAIGVILAIEEMTGKTPYAASSADGYVYAERENTNFKTIRLTISAENTTRNDLHRFVINDYVCSIGKEVHLRVEHFWSRGVITDITTKAQEGVQ